MLSETKARQALEDLVLGKGGFNALEASKEALEWYADTCWHDIEKDILDLPNEPECEVLIKVKGNNRTFFGYYSIDPALWMIHTSFWSAPVKIDPERIEAWAYMPGYEDEND